MKDFFDLMASGNPRKLTPLHRAVMCGNFNALKLLLDSPLCHEAHKYVGDLAPELRNTTLIDLNAQDKVGRTPRDYSHKIVFMSKLLYKAQVRQVWLQADLKSLETEVKRTSVMSNYDKPIKHTCLNSVFLEAEDRKSKKRHF